MKIIKINDVNNNNINRIRININNHIYNIYNYIDIGDGVLLEYYDIDDMRYRSKLYNKSDYVLEK